MFQSLIREQPFNVKSTSILAQSTKEGYPPKSKNKYKKLCVLCAKPCVPCGERLE